MKRRTAGASALAALAVAAGVGTAWWRAKATGEFAAPSPPDLWALAFQDLDGGLVRMADWRSRPLVLNFWATWCGPCVTEMPLLDQFAKEHSGTGWRVLALAIDQADPVRRFLAERSLSLPVALAGPEGIDLSRALGNDLGALPFSVAFDSTGRPFARKLGALTPDLLAAWVGLTHR